jgi:drug/metabolite transporter (DMT)-like permease
VVKAALGEFSPLAFNSLRFVLASVLLFVFLRAAGQRLRFERRDIPALIGLGLLGNLVYQILFIHGIAWTLAGNAALMLSTVPLFVSLLAFAFRHENISPAGWIGIMLSVAGIGLVVWGGARSVSFGAATVRGDLTMLASAVAWSAYTVGSTPLVRRYGTLPVTGTTMWIGTVGLVAVSTPAIRAQDWGTISLPAWGGLFYSGALSIALAYVLWYYGVRHLGGSRTAVYSNTVPVVAILVAWATLGEVPTWMQVVGTALILSGIGLSKIRRRRGLEPDDYCPPE